MTQDTSLTEQGSHEPLNWDTVILPENMDPTKTDVWKVRALAETTTNPILDPIPLGPVRLREFAREMGYHFPKTTAQKVRFAQIQESIERWQKDPSRDEIEMAVSYTHLRAHETR